MGGLPHQALMTAIELYGTDVIPRVRDVLARSAPKLVSGSPDHVIGWGVWGGRCQPAGQRTPGLSKPSGSKAALMERITSISA